ncbi:MAG: hypothetical protein AAGF96_05905 [Bacteroidota bacterium]
MPLQSSDLLIVERGGVQYKMSPTELADFIGANQDHTVADIAARNLLTEVKVGDRVFVTDATADATVDAGWAVYRVQSTSPIVYEKIQEQEGLDLVVVSGHNAASAGGTAQTNPVIVDGPSQEITFNITQLTALP